MKPWLRTDCPCRSRALGYDAMEQPSRERRDHESAGGGGGAGLPVQLTLFATGLANDASSSVPAASFVSASGSAGTTSTRS